MSGPRPIANIQAAHAFVTRVPNVKPEVQMFAFLVNVDGMEVCEAYALAFDRPMRHGLADFEEPAP